MSSGGVMLSGWLRKSPPENKLKSRHHSWKKRWFVLKSGRLTGDPNVLEYSKYQTSKRPIKIIDLNDCKQIDANVTVPVRSDKKDFSQHFIFSIVTSSRTFYLIADSNREMSSWVRCLCDLCGFNNDIANEKDGIGNQKKTFSSCPPTVELHSPGGTAMVAPFMESGNKASSRSAAEKTREAANSKPPYENGRVNVTFRNSSTNGYDSADQDTSKTRRDNPSDDGRQNSHSHINAMPSSVILPETEVPIGAPGDSDYLYLANCETAQGSTLQAVDRSDLRRCSTDSVFEHEDSKPVDLPPPNLAVGLLPRFAENKRLDSMPSVPPPAPPVDIDAAMRDLNFLDDDDDVVDARRKPMMVRAQRGGDEGIYNVPVGMPRPAMLREESGEWKGRSCSSYGSSKQYAMSEYMNTTSGSFSTPSEASESPFIPGLLSASSNTSGCLIPEDANVMSPMFPIHPSTRPGIVLRPPSETDKTVDREGAEPAGNSIYDTPSSIPPARPPKPIEMSPKDFSPINMSNMSNIVGNDSAVLNAQISPKQPLIPGANFESAQSETPASLRSQTDTSASNSPLSTPKVQRWNSSVNKSPMMSARLPHPSVEAGTTASSIYDVPKPLKHPDKDVLPQSSLTSSSSVKTNAIPDFDDIANPSYEKMGSPSYINSEAPCDDTGLYTAMSGTMTSSPRYQQNTSPPTSYPAHADPMICKDSPPPVHRDLKPGRKSLGSDGGSSQGGMDPRKNSARDSCTSEEGISPPHTTVVSVSQFGELSIPNSTTANQTISNNPGSLSPWHGSMPPMGASSQPQRPPRSGHVNNLPPSPLVSPVPSHLSTRSYSPCHIPVRNSNVEKLGLISSPSMPVAPERPPKPLSMKSGFMRNPDNNRIPPRRPPKPGDGSGHAPPRPSKYSMGSMLVPAPSNDLLEKQITYMELELESQRTHSHSSHDPAQDRNAISDLVEYTQLDVGKTQALEKMKKERQHKLHQKSTPD